MANIEGSNPTAEEINAFVDQVNGTEPEPGAEPEPETETNEPESGTETNESNEPNEPNAPDLSQQSKANKRFAEMRVQNKQYKDMFGKLAQVLGMNPDADSEQLLATVNETLLAAQAQAQNVPVEVLQRLDELSRDNTRLMQTQMEQTLRQNLEGLKTKYEVSADEMREFVDNLVNDGIDPFTSQVDIEGEYLKRNFDAIVKNEVQKALKAEMERADKANQHSTSPARGKGKSNAPAAGEYTITSGAQADAFFESLNAEK